MRKVLLLVIMLFAFNSMSLAISDTKKADIKANRQIYHTKRKLLSTQLDRARAEYMSVLDDKTIDEDIKKVKIKELETEIYKINQEKILLKRKYAIDKKRIKDKN